MLAEDFFREGKLEEALADLKARIRKRPDDSRLRIFYFQLLAILGQWDGAFTQLNLLADLDDATLPMVHLYREAIRCELFREKVFSGQSQPTIFGEPPEWIAALLESLRLIADQKYEHALALRTKAFEQAPANPGTIDGEPFDWIADADGRMGPVLEVIVNGRYYWAPFEHIHAIEIEPPEDVRDFVWMPAIFTWANGGQAHGLIPARYPGSEGSGDGMIQLSRKTEWIEASENVFFGLGQRMLTTNSNDFPLFDIRSIKIELGELA